MIFTFPNSGNDASGPAIDRHQWEAVQRGREAHQRHPAAGQAGLHHRHTHHQRCSAGKSPRRRFRVRGQLPSVEEDPQSSGKVSSHLPRYLLVQSLRPWTIYTMGVKRKCGSAKISNMNIYWKKKNLTSERTSFIWSLTSFLQTLNME